MQKAELIQRSKDAKDAIIQFKASDFDRLAAGAGRDYHLVFFLNAAYLASNSQMNLPGLRQQFSLMAKVSTAAQGRATSSVHRVVFCSGMLQQLTAWQCLHATSDTAQLLKRLVPSVACNQQPQQQPLQAAVFCTLRQTGYTPFSMQCADS